MPPLPENPMAPSPRLRPGDFHLSPLLDGCDPWSRLVTPETMPTVLSDFISLEDLAQRLGVTKPTIGTWRRERQLPALRLGARTYFHLPSVAAWLKAQEDVERPARAQTVTP